MRPAAIEIQYRGGVDGCDVTDETDVGVHAVDGDAASHRGEQMGVLAGDPDSVRAVRVDLIHEFSANLAEQHHPRDVKHLRRSDAETRLEIACNTETFQHRGDLGPTAVHDDGVDAAVAQEHHVGGERLP